MTSIVGYVRVSTDKQAQFGVSIEAQERMIRAYCERSNLRVVEVIGDEAVSGTVEFRDRAGGQRVISMLMAGDARGVVVVAIDRLGRDAEDMGRVQRAIIGSGLELHTITGRIRLDNVGDQIVMDVMGRIAEEERRKIGLRTQAGMDQLHVQGKQSGRVPMTALVEVDAAGVKRLVDNPAMLEAANMAARLRDGGMNYVAIGRALSAAGYHPPVLPAGKPRKSNVWHHHGVRSLIMQAKGWRGCHGVNRPKPKGVGDLLEAL